MKVKIIYKSKKNTKKVIDAIGKEIGVVPEKMDEVKKIEDTDVLFFGFGIYGGNVPPEVLEFAKNMDFSQVKKTVLVTTSGFGKDQTDSVKNVLKEKGVPVEKEVFAGRGRFMVINWSQPDEGTLQEAVRFAKKWVKGRL